MRRGRLCAPEGDPAPQRTRGPGLGELGLAGYGNYVWKRLRIISSEDVGLADSNVAVQVRALYQNWLDQTRKKTDHPGFARAFILHAVCILTRAPKSRMLDHALIALYEGERPELPIPDYALRPAHPTRPADLELQQRQGRGCPRPSVR